MPTDNVRARYPAPILFHLAVPALAYDLREQVHFSQVETISLDKKLIGLVQYRHSVKYIASFLPYRNRKLVRLD